MILLSFIEVSVVMSRLATFLMSVLFAQGAWSADISKSFQQHYHNKTRLSSSQIEKLKDHDVYFIPGLFSELFIQDNHDAKIDLSIITKEYFEEHIKHFRILGINVQRIGFNSASIPQTKKFISDAMKKSVKNGRKAYFMTHSLGGLCLLDFLLENSWAREHIMGIVFLNAPFLGTSIASIYMDNPYMVRHWTRPILPFLNISLDTIKYLTQDHRRAAMKANGEKIKEMLKGIPAFTVTGNMQGQKSVFSPAENLMQHGCVLNAWGLCLSPKIFKGPFANSDGLVPVDSTKLEYLDNVELDGVDHGELVVRIPHQDYEHHQITETFFKLLLERE